MATGRPTEYKAIYVEKVDEYLESRVDAEVDVVTLIDKGEGEEPAEYSKSEFRVKLPTIEGFALFLEVNKTSLYEWEKKHDDFSNALGKIRNEQKQRLIDMGLSGKYSPLICKLILSANHDMREKADLTSKGEKVAFLPSELHEKHGLGGDKDS